MTYDIKLDLVFNTLDRSALRQAIKDNYLERKGVTTLIDSINRSSIVIYDGIKKEWRDGDDVIDTMRRSTLLPFAVGKACHYIALNGCCGDQYESLFNYKIIKLANAYILTMLPIVKQQKIDKLEEDLIPLEKQQNSALDAIKEASQVVIDLKLEELKKKVLDINQQIKELNSAILGLTAFQSEIAQAEDNASNLWGLLNKNYEDKRSEWIPIVKQLNIYANELKNVADLGQTLVVANARLQNFTSEKTKLDQDFAELENQNKVAHEARLLTAYKNLADITAQLTEIKNELAILKK